MVTMSDGARHNDPSLCDPAKGEGLAKRDESSIHRRWEFLLPEREQDPSLLDVVERRGSSLFDEVKGRGFYAPLREQESSLSDFVGERGSFLPFAVGDRLLTLGEETKGVGFSPLVKKPTVQVSHLG